VSIDHTLDGVEIPQRLQEISLLYPEIRKRVDLLLAEHLSRIKKRLAIVLLYSSNNDAIKLKVKSIYGIADEIFIVNGTIGKTAHRSPNGYYDDAGIRESLLSNDIDSKIHYIRKVGGWKSSVDRRVNLSLLSRGSVVVLWISGSIQGLVEIRSELDSSGSISGIFAGDVMKQYKVDVLSTGNEN